MILDKTTAQIIFVIILLTVGFVFGVAWSNQQFQTNTAAATTNDRIETIESNGFTLIARHVGNTDWEYAVTGVLSNKCSRYDLTEIVAESIPERVTVTLAVSEPADDTLCAQELQKVEETGVFSASKDALVSFAYTEENTRPSATGLESKNEN